MTRIADYSRFSTDLQSDRSIADQQRLCEDLAATIATGGGAIRHFSDAALSGASMIGRSGIQGLLRAARAREFDVVVAESLDRLSRDQADIATIYKLLKFAGVRLVTFAEGEIDEMKIGFKGTMNALFLNDLRQKTRRGLRGRVEAGRSAGGRSYGYRTISRGVFEIDPQQAAVVQRIFRWFVSGVSPKAIAKALNAEGIPGPGGCPWSPSTIHGHAGRGTGFLNNELYVGRRVWNRHRFLKDPDTGKRVARPNPREEWVIKDVPHLRILDDELWDAAKLRQRAARQQTQAGIVGARRPIYLFSGLTKCGTCGGGFTLSSRSDLRCFNNTNRGTCANGRTLKRQELEARVLTALKEKFLTREAFDVFCQSFTEELNAIRREHRVKVAAAPREIAALNRRSDEILALLLKGFEDERWKEELRQIQQRRGELKAIMAAAATEPPVPALHPKMAEVFRQKTVQLAAALEQDDEVQREAARQALRGFIDRIIIPPGDGLLSVVGNLGEMLTAAGARSGSAPAVGYVGCGGGI